MKYKITHFFGEYTKSKVVDVPTDKIFDFFTTATLWYENDSKYTGSTCVKLKGPSVFFTKVTD